MSGRAKKLYLCAIDAAQRLFVASSITLIPASALLTTFDATMRYAFNAPTGWSQDVSSSMLFVLFVLGLPYSIPGNFHVRMDIIYECASAPVRALLDTIGFVGALVIGLVLSERAWQMFLQTFNNGQTFPSSSILLWPLHLMGAIGLTAFSLVLMLGIPTFVSRILGRETTDEQHEAPL